ncbi:MAG: selenide, water dikinase SelD [Candidatus Eisenbacteria bacterium]|nr:selenide, water dikinase SelD [Candidatus Eisenbacteria bacterium]
MGPADLRQALEGLPAMKKDRRVLVDHSSLDDAGVFAYGRGEALVQTVDFFTPVVDDPYDFGQVAAANAVSDVYAMGATPITALAILCVPETPLPEGTLRAILAGGQDKLKEAGVSILGGHSVKDPELKFGYAVTGVAPRRRLLTNAGARAGDRLILTKPLGAGVLATALKRGELDPAAVRRMTRVMATLNRAASEAAVEYGARAATDVTGFGLIGHALQMADASAVTFRLRPSREWFQPRALDLAARGVAPGGLKSNREFYGPRIREGLIPEPLRLGLYDPQTSGGLLIAIPPRRASAFRAALRRRRVWHVDAGEVAPRSAVAIELEAG